jgi:SAM-dependent methyltransferase
MRVLHKIASAFRVLKKDGLHPLVSILRNRYGLPIPQSAKSKWKAGIDSELSFWDDYCRTRGLKWSAHFNDKLDPDLPLENEVSTLLPERTAVHILDVGAGPLSCLGKKCPGKQVTITAVDPLADEYDKILAKYQIQPPVRTQKLAAEGLTKRFQPNTFDLVYARNCIDHAYDPERAILEMITVAKEGCYVLLKHRENEAINEKYGGLHQWNFSMTEGGDFLISSKDSQVNFSQKHAGLGAIVCERDMEFESGMPWLLTRIQKKA